MVDSRRRTKQQIKTVRPALASSALCGCCSFASRRRRDGLRRMLARVETPASRLLHSETFIICFSMCVYVYHLPERGRYLRERLSVVSSCFICTRRCLATYMFLLIYNKVTVCMKSESIKQNVM